MELKDLLTKPASECTDEELEKQAHLLSKLKLVSEKIPGAKPKHRTNADARLDDLIKNMTKEQLKAILDKRR